MNKRTHACNLKGFGEREALENCSPHVVVAPSPTHLRNRAGRQLMPKRRRDEQPALAWEARPWRPNLESEPYRSDSKAKGDAQDEFVARWNGTALDDEARRKAWWDASVRQFNKLCKAYEQDVQMYDQANDGGSQVDSTPATAPIAGSTEHAADGSTTGSKHYEGGSAAGPPARHGMDSEAMNFGSTDVDGRMCRESSPDDSSGLSGRLEVRLGA
jgi:hypothetical protein